MLQFLSPAVGQHWISPSIPTHTKVLRPCGVAPPNQRLSHPSPMSHQCFDTLLRCLITGMKVVGDQPGKWEPWVPQSHITDFAATPKAAERRENKEKIQCGKTQGRRHVLLSKTQGKCHESAEQKGRGSAPTQSRGDFLTCYL